MVTAVSADSSGAVPSLTAVTLQPANGRIWHSRPIKDSTTGLEAVLCAPASAQIGPAKPAPLTTATQGSSQHLAIVDKRGDVFNLNWKANRYVKLDRAGCPGTSALYGLEQTLFVGFQDGSIRAYHTTKSMCLGILREHRTPVRQLALRTCNNTLLSVSLDSIVMWDAKKLERRRSLGGGPWGALIASFTQDEEHVVAAFTDGSFYVWRAANASLVRSFTLSVPPDPSTGPPPPAALHPLRSAHTTMTLSPDGRLMVAAGLELPFLLVFNWVSGTFLYALLLPDTQFGSGHVTGASQLAFVSLRPAAPQSVMSQGEGSDVSGSGSQGAGGEVGLLVLCSDGSVRLVDMQRAKVVMQIPYAFTHAHDRSSFSVDDSGTRLAVVAAGKVLLYHLPTLLNSSAVDKPLTVIPADRWTVAWAQLPQLGPISHLYGQQVSDYNAHSLASTGGVTGSAGALGTHDTALRDQQQQHNKNNTTRRAQGASPAKAAATARHVSPSKRGKGAKGGGEGGSGTVVTLQRGRLESLLSQYGEYPAKYRIMIWEFLLKLPNNQPAYQALVNMGPNPAYTDLNTRLPLANKALATRLHHLLSQLAHWCPLFGEVGFLPGLVFPFVKLHMSVGTPASSPACFETVATVLLYWTRGWFERFPEPPLSVLARFDALLAFHDGPLATHLRSAHTGGVASLVWDVLMRDLMSAVLCQHDWLKVWDHCLTAGPHFFMYFMCAYLVSLRTTLLGLDNSQRLRAYLTEPTQANINKVLKHAYRLHVSTPQELQPLSFPRATPLSHTHNTQNTAAANTQHQSSDWQPLPAQGDYTAFTEYPHAAVTLFAQERQRIAAAEEALARRRRVVSELALRSTALGLTTSSLAQERKQLMQLQQARRDQMRQLELAMLSEAQRLDDKAKEERLKQIAMVERTEQELLSTMRSEWQSELSSLRRDVAERRQAVLTSVQGRAEAESIAQLEFQAQQKLAALGREAEQQAILTRMREEAQSHMAELEALQRRKVMEWEAEEERRRIQTQHAADRARRRVQAAEDSAAQAAVRREMVTTRLAVEENIARLEAEKQLRTLAEQQAERTREAEQTEAEAVRAAAAADSEALELQARLDASWYESERARRAQLLSEHQAALAADESTTRQQLAATQAQARRMGQQAVLLERRRTLELLNAEEETQVRRVIEAIQSERARAAQLAVELEGREAALAMALAKARRPPHDTQDTGQVGRVSPPHPPVVAPLGPDLRALRTAHAQQIAEIARDLEQADREGGSVRRAVLQREELSLVRDHVSQLEARIRAVDHALHTPGERLPTPQAVPGPSLGSAAAAAFTPVPVSSAADRTHEGLLDTPLSPFTAPFSLPDTPAAALTMLGAMTAGLGDSDNEAEDILQPQPPQPEQLQPQLQPRPSRRGRWQTVAPAAPQPAFPPAQPVEPPSAYVPVFGVQQGVTAVGQSLSASGLAASGSQVAYGRVAAAVSVSQRPAASGSRGLSQPAAAADDLADTAESRPAYTHTQQQQEQGVSRLGTVSPSGSTGGPGQEWNIPSGAAPLTVAPLSPPHSSVGAGGAHHGDPTDSPMLDREEVDALIARMRTELALSDTDEEDTYRLAATYTTGLAPSTAGPSPLPPPLPSLPPRGGTQRISLGGASVGSGQGVSLASLAGAGGVAGGVSSRSGSLTGTAGGRGSLSSLTVSEREGSSSGVPRTSGDV